MENYQLDSKLSEDAIKELRNETSIKQHYALDEIFDLLQKTSKAGPLLGAITPNILRIHPTDQLRLLRGIYKMQIVAEAVCDKYGIEYEKENET